MPHPEKDTSQRPPALPVAGGEAPPVGGGEPVGMRLNRLSLRFEGHCAALEQPFLADYLRRSLPQVRLSLLLAAALIALFGLLDLLLLPLHRHITWTIRYALLCPAILAAAAFTGRRWLQRRLQPSLCTLMVLVGMGITAMIVIAPVPVNHFYYAGLILVIFYGYTYIRLRFAWACLAGWIIVLLYEAAAVASGTPLPVLVNNNFFFISANIIGMLAGYAIEYTARRDFFLVGLLERERRQVKQANRSLETRVAERTAELTRLNAELNREIVERRDAERRRRELELQLQQAQKMETIGNLAAGVAHDLNNILSGLVSYPELLQLKMPADSPLREPLAQIQRSGELAAAMVQDLLTMARRGSARQEVVDLAALTGAYLASTELRQLRGEHPQVRIAAAVAPEPLTVRGVPAHLTKILMNLAANGAEAHQGPGEVRIAAGRRRLQQPLEGFETVPAGDYVCLTVGDTGTGIAPADRGRIFEPFFTKKRLRRSGTGLGMTVVWSALKEMDGFIQVSSGEGRGTIFTLFFPFTPDAPAPAAGAPEEAAMRGTERVLVVDDEPQQRQIATAMLQQLGYRVAAAPGGEEALAALERQPADILLLDMLMDPGIDGCETYRRIIARHPGQRAVIASGYADSDRLREVRRLGAGGLIRKPYRLEELARAVRAELERDAAPPRAEEGGDR